MTNGACGSRPHSGQRSDRDDTIRDVKFLDTPEKRGDGHRYYSRSGSERYHGHHRYNP